MFDEEGYFFKRPSTKEVKFSPFEMEEQDSWKWGQSSIWFVGSTLVDMDEVKKEVKLATEYEPSWIKMWRHDQRKKKEKENV